MAGDEQAAVRLGKAELGRHAFEQRMPNRIARKIESESVRNKCLGVISALAVTLESDKELAEAYLCHEAVVQVSKLRGEGNHFCAYRNMQMLLHPYPTYSIPELQQMIEHAWEQGFNSYGAVETGGIKGTRKHIGTAEAQALFRSLDVPCTAVAITKDRAWQELLDTVETYFAANVEPASPGHVYRTSRAPVFLQRPNHSLTIVGIERDKSGNRRLLVFDPGYQAPSVLKRAASSERPASIPRLYMHRYRRDEAHLKKFDCFEMLFLTDNVEGHG